MLMNVKNCTKIFCNGCFEAIALFDVITVGMIAGKIGAKIGINTNYIGETEKVLFNWTEESDLESDSSIDLDIELPYDLLKNELKDALQGLEVNGQYFNVRSSERCLTHVTSEDT